MEVVKRGNTINYLAEIIKMGFIMNQKYNEYALVVDTVQTLRKNDKYLINIM